MSFIALVISFFVVMNALGNIPLFISILGKFNIKKQRRIITREMIIALFILLLFNFFGDTILRLLGISQPIIGIAGGTLLFIIALGMIFPSNEHTETSRHEPLIVPLATPMVAGPGAIATIMVYADQVHNSFFMAGAIFVAWVGCFVILFASSNIKYFLGKKGLEACEKLGGMIIILIAVQMFSSGIMTLIKDTFYKPTTIEYSH